MGELTFGDAGGITLGTHAIYIKRKHKKCLRELGGSAIATLHEHIITSSEFSSNEQRKASGSLGRVCETRLARTVDARKTISKQSRTFNNIYTTPLSSALHPPPQQTHTLNPPP